MKKPSQKSFEIYAKKNNGENVDDIAFEYDISNVAVYKAINKVKKYYSEMKIARITDLPVTNGYYFNDILSNCPLKIHHIYEICKSLYIENQSILKTNDKNIIQINLDGWDYSDYKCRKKIMIKRLLKLSVFIFKPFSGSLYYIAPHQPFKVFEDVTLNKNIISLCFSEEMQCCLENIKFMINFSKYV